MQPMQLPLFSEIPITMMDIPFPSTRYQGSKRKLLDWLQFQTQHLKFDTVLDVFGGTGAVSHLFKRMGKEVIYNDYLKFNTIIGQALIANHEIKLTPEETQNLLDFRSNEAHPHFIQETFSGIYFTDEENAWLDRVIYNINTRLTNPFKQAIALFALFQSCIIKRPYNLFHRANLYMRLAGVKRSFGNKTTWDTPFETHFRTFIEEANNAVFDNGRHNQSLNMDAMQTPIGSDLVYIDPPYLNQKGVGVNYRDFYHFLEGITNYDRWGEAVDYDSKHRRLIPELSCWDKAETILSGFEDIIRRHQDSTLVISYRDNGLPTKTVLVDLLRSYKKVVDEASLPQKYALAHQNSHELLLIGR